METRVVKFGGSTFATVADYRRVALFLKEQCQRQSQKLVVVVSAPTGLTESLRHLAWGLNKSPSPENLDALLPLADTVGMALLRNALEGAGVKATSLSGFQVGILTDTNHQRARLCRFDDGRLRQALKESEVVVVPGGQGIEANQRPTWLGKNSSDLTAIILAAALGNKSCEIFSDVCGVYSTDPNAIPQAQLLSQIGYDSLIEMSLSGAKVMHYNAIRFAKQHQVRIVCRLNREDYRSGTVIEQGPSPKAVVVDERSVILEFASPAERDQVRSHLNKIQVPSICIDEAEACVLAVTCGFFDAVGYLSHQGLGVQTRAAHLVTEFRGDEELRRHIVSSDALDGVAQTLHHQLYEPEMGARVSHLVPRLQKKAFKPRWALINEVAKAG